MPKKRTKNISERDKEKAFNYLLVQYLKEISNELTYLLLVVAALFLFMIMDILPELVGRPPVASYSAVRTVFIILVIGGFFLFGISNATKKKIEKQIIRVLS